MNDIQSVKHDSVLSHPSRAKRPLDRVIIFRGGLQRRRQSCDSIDDEGRTYHCTTKLWMWGGRAISGSLPSSVVDIVVGGRRPVLRGDDGSEEVFIPQRQNKEKQGRP